MLTIEDTTLHRVRAAAEAKGKSVDQLVREYLERVASQEDVESDIRELRQLSDPPRGNSKGWRFDREQLYDRVRG